jgi:hypothetical protein
MPATARRERKTFGKRKAVPAGRSSPYKRTILHAGPTPQAGPNQPFVLLTGRHQFMRWEIRPNAVKWAFTSGSQDVLSSGPSG